MLSESACAREPRVSVELSFRAGTLELRGIAEGQAPLASLKWDPREAIYRAPASEYAALVRAILGRGLELNDRAKNYQELELSRRIIRKPRPFQAEALRAWNQAKGRGVVVLPTGSGKSHVAILAINATQRSTLVVAPTLDLVRQWYDLLRTTFDQEVGIVGGGSHTILPITVTTYDSAYLHMEHLGNRFGLIVFDECHHLPGESYALTARLCLAPFRLGLTATLERADGRQELLAELIGETVYQQDITDLSGEYLADYQTERIVVDLSAQERVEYQDARATYLAFVRSSGIHMGSPRGFSEFIMRASRTPRGKEALVAYRRQRTLALAASGKLKVLEHLLHLHRRDKTIVFTQDNATAYGVSQRFLIPVITHQTKIKERSELLEGFHEGRYRAIVTSKVLNEGVDIPSASVAVVLSGSGSVMEHVQRLGRILRRHDDKKAVLYELVAKDTSETSTSDRRREHSAYKGKARGAAN